MMWRAECRFSPVLRISMVPIKALKPMNLSSSELPSSSSVSSWEPSYVTCPVSEGSPYMKQDGVKGPSL